MEMLALYTFAALALAILFLVGAGKWLQTRESSKLRSVLKNGAEQQARILHVQRISPSLLNSDNIKLKVELLGGKPETLTFSHDSPEPEAHELVAGEVITISIDPADRRNVLIVRKSTFAPARVGSLAAIKG